MSQATDTDRDMSDEAVARRLADSEHEVDQAIGQLLLSALNEEANS